MAAQSKYCSMWDICLANSFGYDRFDTEMEELTWMYESWHRRL